MADPQPPSFEFDGAWPFTGTVKVNGHPVTTVSSWVVGASPDGLPKVTLTLVAPEALKLIFASESARAEVSDETREALISLGWKPPAD